MFVDLISISVGLFEWILFSIGLRGVEKKVGCEKPWMAWIPGLRFTSLGKAIKMNFEGIFCGILDLMYIAVAVAMAVVSDGDAHVVVSLISLVVFVFLFIYRIRMFLQIIKVFGLKKRWIILFLVVSWLAVMIIGFGKVFHPRKETLHDEYWQAGTAPAQIPGAEAARRDTAHGPVCGAGRV